MTDVGKLTPHVLASNLLKNVNDKILLRDEGELKEDINKCKIILFFVEEFLNSKCTKDELLKLIKETYKDLEKFKAK